MTNSPLKKSFSDGRALAGHMRSHTRKLSASNAESTTSSLKTSNKPGANFRPHETVLMRSVHTKGVGVGPKPDLKREDGVRGKRKLDFDLNEVPESELTADEEGGLILVAMSKGERPENSQHWNAIDRLLSTTPNVGTLTEDNNDNEENDDDDDDDDNDHDHDDDDDDDDDDDETYLVATEKKCKKKYVCDICGKVLYSYQELGGHQTSHRNKQLKICDKYDQAVVRQYDCKICGRVFESGQALGGHKKVHNV